MILFFLPGNVFGQTNESWDEDTVIDVSVVGTSIINLDSPNTLLRLYVNVTNFDPSDGYYFLQVIQSATGSIISEENIIIREKSNGFAGADVAHLMTEDELSSTGSLEGNYDVLVYTENGSVKGSATFSIIKPSQAVPEIESVLGFNETSTENEESILTESPDEESELINAKKIPDWVKNIFVMYSYDEISENELINALKYLIEQGIIEITQ